MNPRQTGLLVAAIGAVASLLLCCGVLVCAGVPLLDAFDGGPDPAPQQPRTWVTGDRHSRLAAPGRPARYDMRFGDGRTGYVLFQSCERPCPATLYRTADGGSSWQQVPLDLRGADARWLVVAGPDTLAISVDGGYHVSRDGGRTFVTEPDLPADLASPTGGRARLACRSHDDDGGCQRYEVARGGTPVPVQPPLPPGAEEVDAVTEDATGRIWAVTAVRTTVHTAVSTDRGASWRTLPDLDGGFRVGGLELTAAADDREPWLVLGHHGSANLSAYRGGPDRWRTVADTTPVDGDWTTATSAGGGVVALYGEHLGVLSDDGRWRSAPPTGVLSVSRLADGSLAASTRSLQGMWVGARDGDDFAWAHVTVEPV